MEERGRFVHLEKEGFVGGKEKLMVVVDHLALETTHLCFTGRDQKWQVP